MIYPPEIKNCIAFLCIQSGNKYLPIGTAFYVAKVEGEDIFTYLITCKHVVKSYADKNRKIYMRLNRTDKDNVAYIELSNDWMYHIDQCVDLAVLPWKQPVSAPPCSLIAVGMQHVLLSDEILNEANFGLYEGWGVFFFGLFPQYMGIHHNFPIMRTGKIALIPNEPVYGEYGLSQYIFVECQVYPGNSGSPLFMEFEYKGKSELHVLGLVSAFYPDDKYSYKISNRTIGLQTHTGISLAIPYNKIREVIFGDTLMKQRTDKVKASKIRKAPQPAFIKV